MPQVDIRSAEQQDLTLLVNFKHDYESHFIWQLVDEGDDQEKLLRFREMRFPRAIHVQYPFAPQLLLENWQQSAGLLVGLVNHLPVGYVKIQPGSNRSTACVTDVVVDEAWRRQGIASCLLLATSQWAQYKAFTRVLIPIQPRNYPAIKLLEKNNYNFCGYQEHYFPNNDLALFFELSTH